MHKINNEKNIKKFRWFEKLWVEGDFCNISESY